MNRLNRISNQLRDIEKLSFKDAKNMYIETMKIEDINERNKKINEIIQRSLYAVYDYVKKCNYDSFNTGAFNEEDIFQTCCENFILAIKNDGLLKSTSFSYLMSDGFTANVQNKIVPEVHDYNYTFFKDLLNIYMGIKEKNKIVTLQNMLDYLKENNYKKYYTDLSFDPAIFSRIERIYNVICKKIPEEEITKRKIELFVPLFLYSDLNEGEDINKVYAENLYDELINEDCVQELMKIIFSTESLTEREKFILEKRFGLNGNREHTLQEISNMVGVCKEIIRQKEKYALRKISCNWELKSKWRKYDKSVENILH